MADMCEKCRLLLDSAVMTDGHGNLSSVRDGEFERLKCSECKSLWERPRSDALADSKQRIWRRL